MNNLPIPWFKCDRAAFLVLFILGFALCTVGGMNQAPIHGWWHPVSLVGYTLGVVALMLGGSVLFRLRVAPFSNDRAALLGLLTIIVLKIVLAGLYRLIP
jgi:hypothetical protein